MILTIAVTNSALAIVDGASTRGATALLGLSAEDSNSIQQNAVRFVAIDKGGIVQPFCSGILSGLNEVLTAGHCFSDPESKIALSEGRVYAEVFDSNQRARGFKKRVKVSQAEIRQDSGADLAVALLDGELSPVRGIPLAFSGCDKDSEYIFGGFGKTEDDKMSSDVRLARYRELSEKELSANPGRFFILATFDNLAPEWIVLAKKGVGHICRGDSGGPLFCRSHGRLAVAGITANQSYAQLSETKGVDLSVPKRCRVVFDHAVATRLKTTVSVVQTLRARLHKTDDVFANSATGRHDVLSEW